jgi:hypothetical protein
MAPSEESSQEGYSNPWEALRHEPPYVLASDRPYLDAYNATLKPDDTDHRIVFDFPPEPFLGLRSTPVVVLSCNPAFSLEAGKQFTLPGFKDAAISNLTAPGGAALYPLEDRFKDTPGGIWWRRRLKGLLPATENGYSDLARLVSSIEFHGYWSKNWEAPLVTLPSQHYSFGLVVQAMERRATIILARAERHWKQAVPSLGQYDRLVTTRTPRVSALSEGNLSPEHFKMVMASLVGGER